MFDNHFTPIFGGKPDFFFGRKTLLERFERALSIRGSDDRTLFITGTRGSGKTALVEQLSRRASSKEWYVVDLTADNALQSFFRQIQEFDEMSSTIDPKIEVKVLGSGGSAGGKSTTKTARYSSDDMDVLFRRACEKAKMGFFVSIDEVQKVSLEDLSKICGAFQMASRKGHDVILVVAGLPHAFERAIQHEGCTYLRRSVHETLGLFTPTEVHDALSNAFDRINGLSLQQDALDTLVQHSSGHPYMMQLLGYHLVEYINGAVTGKTHKVSRSDVETIWPVALDAYERRALEPIVDSLSGGMQRYLVAMTQVMGQDHTAQTGDVAKALGKTHQQLASTRQSLIGQGTIAECGRGKIRFAIPYLREYLGKPNANQNQAALLAQWDV